jgi:hypothetical protein
VEGGVGGLRGEERRGGEGINGGSRTLLVVANSAFNSKYIAAPLTSKFDVHIAVSKLYKSSYSEYKTRQIKSYVFSTQCGVRKGGIPPVCKSISCTE